MGIARVMLTLALLAGPNGAGKTTFIDRFLRQRAETFRFVNPDAASLSRWERGCIASRPTYARRPRPGR